jgi:single-strand DNA-binding protein
VLNHIVLIGRLTRDPEMKYTPSGVGVVNFSIAVDRPFTNQAGEHETDFIDIVAWRKLAETVANHMTKGRLVAIEGRLQIRTYDAQDGSRRRVAEVVANEVRFLDRPKDGQTAAREPGADEMGAPPPETGYDGLPDDLPF